MTEFYNIVDIIRDSLRNSKSINTVTFGDLSEIDLDKTTIFPLAHIFVERVRHEPQILIFDFIVLVADVVDYNKDATNKDDFYKNDNLHDVLNTQLATMNELISSLRRGSLYKDKFQLESSPTVEPFKERFSNLLAGWESTISIQVKNELKVGVCAGDTDTGGGGNNGGNNGGGDNGGGNNQQAPVLILDDKYYITLNENFSLFIGASNNPTSYSVTGLIDGLTLNEETGEITGIVTGEERLEAMSLKAINEYGSDSKLVFFEITEDDVDILLPPYDLSVGRVTSDSYYTVQWDYRPYSGTFFSTKIYKNDDLSIELENFDNGQVRVSSPQSGLESNENTWKFKFVSDNGDVSRFSDEMFVDGQEAEEMYRYRMIEISEDSNSVPLVRPTQFYYIQKDVEFSFDFSKLVYNNPTSYKLSSFFEAGTNSDGYSISITGEFNEETGVVTCVATGDLDDFYPNGTPLTALLQATNSVGDSEGIDFSYEDVKFRFSDNDANQISKPKNVQIDTTEEDYLTWEYEPYNRRITEVEVYRNGDLFKNALNNDLRSKTTGTGVTNIFGDNVWKVRFKDEDGLYSEFSDEISINITDPAAEFLAPYDLYAANAIDNGFRLGWELREYNGTVVTAEIFRQGVFFGETIYEGNNQFGAENKFDVTDSYGEHEWTVRLKDSTGQYSPFSEVFTYSTVRPDLLPENESVTPVNPTMANVVAYYKFDEDVTANGNVVVDETGNNNGYLLGFGSNDNTDGNGLFGSGYFKIDNRNDATTVVIPNSPELSFTDGSVDQPFSISIWFKMYGDGKGFYDLVRKGYLYDENENSTVGYEYSLQYIDNSTPTNGQTPEITLTLRDDVETNFIYRQVNIPIGQGELNYNNGWNNIVVTNGGNNEYEGDNTFFYINGYYKQAKFTPPAGDINNDYVCMRASEAPLTIGNFGRPNDWNDGFDDTRVVGVEEVVIFNKVLSKDEVNFIYNNRQGNPITNG